METSLPTPTTARVYVNLPEGKRNPTMAMAGGKPMVLSSSLDG
jgi:hypothetical protein